MRTVASLSANAHPKSAYPSLTVLWSPMVSLIRRMVFTAMYLETSNMIASNCQSRIFFKAGLRCRLTMRNGTTSERRPVSQSVRIFCNAR